jgi:DNA recombination protein RmuC
MNTEAATQAAVTQERSVNALVEPVDKKLRELDQKIETIERARNKESGELKSTLDDLKSIASSLQRETLQLASAMKDNRARGRWGEIQLKRVVELAGMREYCDFTTQQTLVGTETNRRPDLIVSLPNARSIIVDAKVPMSAYLSAMNAADDATRESFMQQHARDVAKHVSDLQNRDYSSFTNDALDFVVMFVPGDTFLDAAFDVNATWFEDSIARGVFPASPGTLIALLRAIAYGWRQEQLAANAQKIADLGRELHERIAVVGQNFAAVGKSLSAATTAYNKTVGSVESRLLVTSRRLEDLAVTSSKSTPQINAIEQIPVPLTAPELQNIPLDEVGIAGSGTPD